MKIKLITTALLLIALQNNYAQQVEPVIVIDSVQIKNKAMQNAKAEEEMRLKTELNNQKAQLKALEKSDDNAKREQRKLKNEQDDVRDRQRKIDKAQNKAERKRDNIESAQNKVAKLTNKLADANSDLIKIQEKFAKKKLRGNLSPIEISKFEVKITKQQLKIKEIETDILRAQQKFDKLQQHLFANYALLDFNFLIGFIFLDKGSGTYFETIEFALSSQALGPPAK